MKAPTDHPQEAPATSLIRDAPAFDFYPERWLVGVAGMSDAEQLAYLRLLCHQWLLQGLPADVPALKRLGGGKGVTPAVLAKLPLMPDGKRRNARLETIREEQRERIAKKSEQRRAAAYKRWQLAPGTAPVGSMRPPYGSTCETDAAGMRPHCGSMCETDAAAMPTTHRPPPTAHPVPEDANNAGAHEVVAAEAAATGAVLPAGPLHTGQECPAYAPGAASRQEAATTQAAASRAASVAPASTGIANRVAGAASASTGVAQPPASADSSITGLADLAAGVGTPSTGAARLAGVADTGPPGAAAEVAGATPSLDTVLAWAATLGCPPDKAQIWWHEHEARPLSVFGRWTDRDGNAVQRPQHALAAWWRKWQANDHQRQTRNHPTTTHPANSRPTPARSDSANAPGRYA